MFCVEWIEELVAIMLSTVEQNDELFGPVKIAKGKGTSKKHVI